VALAHQVHRRLPPTGRTAQSPRPPGR
jgi:hypothetical protein